MILAMLPGPHLPISKYESVWSNNLSHKMTLNIDP